MFRLKIASLSFVATVSLMSAPAFAETPGFQGFRSIEFGADPAAMVEVVRTDLAARLAAGSSVANARALLRNAGAHCGAPKANGDVRCRYSEMHFEDDIIQDVSWTVDFDTANGRIVSLAVARDPALD